LRTYLDCVPCFVKQTFDACRMVTSNEVIHEKVVRRVLAKTAQLSFDDSPPHMAREIHRIIRKECRNDDPYRTMKTHFNEFCLSLMPRLRKRISGSADPFETAVRIAIAGNIIDPGLSNTLDDARVTATIDDSLRRPLAINHLEALRDAVANAKRILYLGDNAGEIVFDRLLVEELPFERVTFAVRGKPIINDATREDARVAGLSDMVRVIDNGSDAPGTILNTCTQSFLRVFDHADVIIAKGQGNYETLNDVDRPLYFLLKAKCSVIAADLGCEIGSIVVKGTNVTH